MKLWSGFASKEADKLTNDFNSSIAFDSRMYKQDIRGSVAHATMLMEQGIISPEDGRAIIDGLYGMLADIENGALEIDMEAEDIHTFVEGELTARIGDAGKRLHTARSRNDQVATDLRLYLRDEIDEIALLVRKFAEILLQKAALHVTSIMPGFTHLQRAQPITFAHHLMAYVEMSLRDLQRLNDCRKRMNVSPLGSGALAGTTYPLDRSNAAGLLQFDGITQNSLDGVSDRDFVLELASVLSIVMVHLSRLAEETILWCSSEFKFIRLDDAFSTGSSIMPQKKNPDISELVRGKAGRVFGHLSALLCMMKGIPLAYNKDLQEDKEAIFDAVDTVKMCLTAFTPMIDTMTVNTEAMRRAAAEGFINATDAADFLVSKDMPFRDAYKVVGRLVAYCTETKQTLEGLSLAEYRQYSLLFDDNIYSAVSLENCVERRTVDGAPAPQYVKAQIVRVREYLEELK